MTTLNAGQRKAREWFDSLEVIPEDQAIAMLQSGDHVPVLLGSVLSHVSREEALRAIANGARRPSNDQAYLYRYHQLVVIGDDGFPMQLRTQDHLAAAARSQVS